MLQHACFALFEVLGGALRLETPAASYALHIPATVRIFGEAPAQSIADTPHELNLALEAAQEAPSASLNPLFPRMSPDRVSFNSAATSGKQRTAIGNESMGLVEFD